MGALTQQYQRTLHRGPSGRAMLPPIKPYGIDVSERSTRAGDGRETRGRWVFATAAQLNTCRPENHIARDGNDFIFPYLGTLGRRQSRALR